MRLRLPALRVLFDADLRVRLLRELERLFEEPVRFDALFGLLFLDQVFRAFERRVDLRVLDLRVALEAVDLRAAVRRLVLPVLLLFDRLRLIIGESPCVGCVNRFLLTFSAEGDSS